jgi:alpha-tubulin suppressor-like RCC1 family protein
MEAENSSDTWSPVYQNVLCRISEDCNCNVAGERCVCLMMQVYAWGDNDHGQQGNGTTIVNRKPAPVHGLEDIHVNRVACGSSHSIAWTTLNMQPPNMHEPVLFVSSNDPLGASTLGK